MKTLTFRSLIAVTALFAVSSCSDNKVDPKQKTFVLVHGAWQGAYVWQQVKAQLEQKGQKVIVVELPAHGEDNSPPENQTLDGYRDVVIEAVQSANKKVILVGHSMGGMVISEAAEEIPALIEKQIYIGAFLPANGESLMDLAGQDAQSHLGPSLVFSDKPTVDVKPENLIDIFCQDGSDAVKELLIAKYRPEPIIPFTNKATLTAGAFGKVLKYYIYTSEDHAIGIELQKLMVARTGIKKVYTLKSGHCPFLSMPDKVTETLMDIIK